MRGGLEKYRLGVECLLGIFKFVGSDFICIFKMK